jgi:hypothetical protein
VIASALPITLSVTAVISVIGVCTMIAVTAVTAVIPVIGVRLLLLLPLPLIFSLPRAKKLNTWDHHKLETVIYSP